MAVNENRVFACALEAIVHFRQTLMPLKNITRDVIDLRRLNSSERQALRNLVFSFCRNYFVVEAFCASKGHDFLKLSSQEKDALAMTLIASDDQHHEVMALRASFNDYRKNLKEEAYLLALGPTLTKELTSSYAKDAPLIAKGLSQRAIEYLAFDRNHITKEALSLEISARHFTPVEHPLIPFSLGIREGGFDVKTLPKEFHGRVWVMDASSQLVASMIEAHPSSHILDMCAGTGQKTRFLAQTNAQITAMDVDKRRLSKAEQMLSNKNIRWVVADGKNPPFQKDCFDFILLDAPCSGTGVLRRQFDSVFRFTTANLKNYLDLQASLLKSAVHLLKPGGILVYATCSILPQENQHQIKKVLKNNPTMTGYRPQMLAQLPFMNKAERLSDYSLQLFPHVHQTDGLFFACLQKSGGA